MMNYIMTTIICGLFLIGCSNVVAHDEESKYFETRPVTDVNQRYETERMSYLAPWLPLEADEPWFSSHNTKYSKGIQSFRYGMGSGKRSMQVIVDGFDPKNSMTLKEVVEKRKKNGLSSPIVSRGTMKCLRLDTYAKIFGRTNQKNLRYYCEEPNQPHLPLITIWLSQTVSPGYEFWDMDKILSPIFKSMKFKKIDPTTSRAYQKWMEKRGK